MRFSYKRYSETFVRPVIPILITARDHWLDYEAQVDSGADICVFDAELAVVVLDQRNETLELQPYDEGSE